ncbi:MAG: glycosyltransferase, partial [Desulfovibrio sp.]|nr:glycosyltransferase [Desulfovibrio sp.]
GTYTQPWGGAMAIRASTFRGKGIGAFWASNVVDDCSLTGFLKDAGVKVRLCPGALLQTRARQHGLRFWTDWLERQVLFLKFCVPDQWRQLVFGILLVSFIPLTLGSCLLSLLLLRPSGWLLLCGAACLAACAVSASSMRPFVARHVRLVPWLAGYLLSSVVFCIAALKTLGAKGLRWHGIWYEVGRQGRVISTKR